MHQYGSDFRECLSDVWLKEIIIIGRIGNRRAHTQCMWALDGLFKDDYPHLSADWPFSYSLHPSTTLLVPLLLTRLASDLNLDPDSALLPVSDLAL